MRNPDRSVDVASVAIRALEYRRDGVAAGAPVPGLLVLDDASGRRGLFHESTGLYGFVNLEPGVRTMRVRDPASRWLPVDVEVPVPDRSALAAALKRGLPPAGGPAAADITVPMFPTLALPIPPAETVLWGVVTVAGAPAPFAYVQVDAPPSVVRGATDADGTFVLWLRNAPHSELDPNIAANLSAAPALSAVDALEDVHATLIPGSPAFLARFAPLSTQPVIAISRRRVRADLSLP